MRFIVRRLGFYAVAAWVAVTVNFFIPRAMPGNAVDTMMAKYPNLLPAAQKALEVEFGVGHQGSLLHQYWVYLGDLFHGNLGLSVNLYPATVTSILAQTIPWTLALVGTATLISFVLGTLLGILAAWRRGGWLDQRPARVHVPAGDALLLPRAARDPAVLAALARLPDRPGLHARAAAGLELAVHRERDLPLDPAGADDHRHLDGGLDAADAQRDDHDDR